MLNKELIIGLFYCIGSMWYGFRILPFGILVFGILPFSISPFSILPIGILLLDVLLMSNLAFHRSSVSKLILFRIYQRYFMKSRTFLLRFCNSRFFNTCARKDFCEKPKNRVGDKKVEQLVLSECATIERGVAESVRNLKVLTNKFLALRQRIEKKITIKPD